MPQGVRFTPDELQELISSGKLTKDTIGRLPDKQDQAVATQLMSHPRAPEGTLANSLQGMADDFHDPNKVKQSMMMLAGQTIPGASQASEGIASAAKAIPSAVGNFAAKHPFMAAGAGAGLSQVSKQFGVPPGVADALSEMFAFKGVMGGGGGPGAKAAAEATKEAKPLSTMGYGKSSGMSYGAGKPGVSASDLDQVEGKIFGGPQAAESRTFGTKPPPYPPNVNTQSNDDELKQLLLGQSGNSTPYQYHNGDPEGLRNSLDTLKRQVKRRSPGGEE